MDTPVDRRIKLTQRDHKRLLATYEKLLCVQAFIDSPETSVCRPFGGQPIAIAKDIGSELCLLPTAINELRGLLFAP
jgi:hypothetical protein